MNMLKLCYRYEETIVTLKTLQLPVKTIPFTPLDHYKTIQANGEKNRTYWNNIV